MHSRPLRLTKQTPFLPLQPRAPLRERHHALVHDLPRWLCTTAALELNRTTNITNQQQRAHHTNLPKLAPATGRELPIWLFVNEPSLTRSFRASAFVSGSAFRAVIARGAVLFRKSKQRPTSRNQRRYLSHYVDREPSVTVKRVKQIKLTHMKR
jgi:hypothetical protein